MMRQLCLFFMLAAFLGCNNKPASSPVDEAGSVLMLALTALNDNDIDAYLDYADLGCGRDTASVNAIRQVLAIYVEMLQAERGPVDDICLIDAEITNDSLCTLLYQYTFADSTNSVLAQQMVLTSDGWKLNLRE